MKKAPDYEKLKHRLESSKFSGSGFLGTDERPVDEIIADDLHQMEINQIDKDDLVDLLKIYYQKIRVEIGRRVRFTDNIYGEYHESMGRIPSPFIGDGVFEKGEAVIVNEKTGETFVITALAINLIEKHDFFQGKGSRYRLDPVRLFHLFDELEE
ncbi:MAG: hypothetical protein JXQ65_10705 [Candidatus Marinimicrobia bacterium]|nr:hypothetical protein [Candidatus Neomarinimicrobiota bacterium]